MKGIGNALIMMRSMVDSFVCYNDLAWDKYRDKYKEEHGYEIGRTLSMQSFLGSDLTIDLAYLARDIEELPSFTNEYWIRSQGMQCIRNEYDRQCNGKVWGDVLGKFKVVKTEDGEINFEWFEDESCLVHNVLIDKGILAERWV